VLSVASHSQSPVQLITGSYLVHCRRLDEYCAACNINAAHSCCPLSLQITASQSIALGHRTTAWSRHSPFSGPPRRPPQHTTRPWAAFHECASCQYFVAATCLVLRTVFREGGVVAVIIRSISRCTHPSPSSLLVPLLCSKRSPRPRRQLPSRPL